MCNKNMWYVLLLLCLVPEAMQSRCPENTKCTTIDNCLHRGRETLLQRCRNGICCSHALVASNDTKTEKEPEKPKPTTPPPIPGPSSAPTPVHPTQPGPVHAGLHFPPFLGVPPQSYGGGLPWHFFMPGMPTSHQQHVPPIHVLPWRRSAFIDTSDQGTDAAHDSQDSVSETKELVTNAEPRQKRSRRKRNVPMFDFPHPPFFHNMHNPPFIGEFHGPSLPFQPPPNHRQYGHPFSHGPPIPAMFPPVPRPLAPSGVIIREKRPLIINMIQYKGIDFRHIDIMCQAREGDSPICQNF